MSNPPAAVARLRDLLPPHVLQRDAESGGLLADLLDAVGRQLDLVEADIEQLYASWFIETCPEWVVPYIADLVGVTELPPDLRDAGADVSRKMRAGRLRAQKALHGTHQREVCRDCLTGNFSPGLNLLPVSSALELPTGLEPVACRLQGGCSTIEL